MPKRDQAMAELYRQHYQALLRSARILLHDEEEQQYQQFIHTELTPQTRCVFENRL